MVCFSDTAFLGGSESDLREVLAGVSRDANTPSSSRFSDHSGKSRNKSAFTGTVASFYFCFWVSVGSRGGLYSG